MRKLFLSVLMAIAALAVSIAPALAAPIGPTP
jgi:hypothetical protein